MQGDAMALEGLSSVHATASLGKAITRLLCSHNGVVSIFDDDHALVGMVTEGDLQEHRGLIAEKHRPRWFALLFGEEKRAVVHISGDSPSFLEVSAHGVTSSEETLTLRAAVDVMKRNNIRRLPVMLGDRLVGTLVSTDLVGVLAVLTSAPTHSVGNAEMRNSILTALEGRR